LFFIVTKNITVDASQNDYISKLYAP